MDKISPLTSEELKEVKDFLKSKNIDIQIQFAPQNIRRMDDGGMVIDPPQFNTSFVKVEKEKTNHEVKKVSAT